MIDLEPATRVLADLVAAVRDEQLTAPTPCADTSLGALLDHVDGLSRGFALAATKTPPEGGSRPPSADASRLAPDWRTRIPRHLEELASAWRDPDAWTGMTQAGGIDLPGEVAGLVALDEVIVHSWDVAVASGQQFSADPALVEAAYGFVRSAVEAFPEGREGLFGPPVPVPDDAPLLARLIGLTGRDPAWTAGGSDA